MFWYIKMIRSTSTVVGYTDLKYKHASNLAIINNLLVVYDFV